ncbi:SGNH/GDSL hydrolase family protein [Myroides odoratimimus]|uniref:SGNH/GDSL hydrolase family protein n=1 Tax=Myroides odoratimimus TaxID=76832 RepID=UPI001CE07E24|nr:SGNH/GDSL hydrolase family protein [Myroides odoratimimus]MCA4806962.1 SGNH/GDSL hydrolase family protein [Myroides odoratimimus]
MYNKHLLTSLILLLLQLTAFGQKTNNIDYHDATSFTIVSKIMPTDQPYHRVDTTKYNSLPPAIKTKLTRSAGIAISFKSNSSSIHAKWCTDSRYSSAGMTPIAYRGLDLYIKNDGKWQFASVATPQNGKKCNEDKLIGNLTDQEKEFLLYLPGYSTIDNLSIGVDNGSQIKKGEYPFTKKILVYGSSIVQGAGASRPGMIYTSRLSRQTGYDFLNLGMSGSAKMEREVADLVSDIPADAYLLDCIPNSSPKQVLERTAYLMTSIREKNPNAPIIVMQSVIRESSYFDQKLAEKVKEQNKNIYKEFFKQHKQGMENIYFIFADKLLGDDHEGTVDGTHPNDLGFDRMIQIIQPQIVEILNKQ